VSSTIQPGLADWYAAIEESFAGAVDDGPIDEPVRIGGTPVLLQLANRRLYDRLAPAFAHVRETSGVSPELTLQVWDSRDGPAPPLPDAPPGPRGTVFFSDEGGMRIAYLPHLHVLSVLDNERKRAWFWCADADALPFWESSAPFRQILHWWLGARKMLLLHAASVGRAEGGVLLVGRGGSGKSTSALACLESDLLYAGDDYVAVDEGAGLVYSLYCSGKLEPGHATRLPHLPAPAIAGDGSADEKAVFFVQDGYVDRICESYPLRAVLAPRIGGDEARMTPLDGGAALRALAPSTLLQLHPAQPDALARMARLVSRVPAFRFDLGPDIAAIPSAIERLLDELGKA
jgi:hypothetical protein